MLLLTAERLVARDVKSPSMVSRPTTTRNKAFRNYNLGKTSRVSCARKAVSTTSRQGLDRSRCSCHIVESRSVCRLCMQPFWKMKLPPLSRLLIASSILHSSLRKSTAFLRLSLVPPSRPHQEPGAMDDITRPSLKPNCHRCPHSPRFYGCSRHRAAGSCARSRPRPSDNEKQYKK